jgi:thymidine phosphorylase
MENPGRYLPQASFSRPVVALEDGYIYKIDARAVGALVVFLGGGRRRASDAIDHSVGISAIAGVGQEVDRDRPLAIIHADSEDSWEQAAARLRAAVTLGPDRTESTAAVDGRVSGESIDANH